VVFVCAALTVAGLGCASQYEASKRTFDEGALLQQGGNARDAVGKYDAALTKLSRPDRDPYESFLIAAILHRLYVMDIQRVFAGFTQEERRKCPRILEIFDKAGGQPDFLGLSFAESIALEDRVKQTDEKKIEKWLLIEKDVIVGDGFSRKAAEGARDMFADSFAILPRDFLDNIVKLSVYEVALGFYARAWQRAGNAEGAGGVARARVKDTLNSIAAVAAWLGAENRSEDFVRDFMGMSKDLQKLAHRIDEMTQCSGPELTCDDEFMSLSPSYHAGEGRSRAQMAGGEMREGKSARAQKYCLESVKHLLIARVLGGTETGGGARSIDDYIGDVVASLDQMTGK
jgi:hypothetical protein